MSKVTSKFDLNMSLHLVVGIIVSLHLILIMSLLWMYY